MMPASVRGVINLRGAVVPVMDLQARFGRPASAVTKRISSDFVCGMAKVLGKPGVVLDAKRWPTSGDVGGLATAIKDSATVAA